VASEVAFLIMDLEFRGAGGLAREFLRHYVELVNDRDLPTLLPFYKCYRALVRGKVEALRSGRVTPEALRYFDLASRITWERFKPFVLVICGLTGSGKTTVAGGLGRRLGLTVINSDATRKALAAVPEGHATVPYGDGIYSLSMTEQTYSRMAEMAEELVSSGAGAILDATFVRRAHRRLIVDLAARRGVPLMLIECRGSERVVRERLKRRAEEGRDLSDGRWDIYLEQKAVFEPIEEIPRDRCLVLETEASPDELIRAAERFLRSLLAGRSATAG